MDKKAINVEFDTVTTDITLDTKKNVINCLKTFWKDGEEIHSDLQIFDLCVLSYSVAMQMACAYVQSSTLTKYE